MVCRLPQYDLAADSRPSQLGRRWTPSTASCRTGGWRSCPKSQHDRTMSSCPSSCGVFMDWTACGEATSSHRREPRKFFYEPVLRALNSTRKELSGTMLTFVRVPGKRKLSSSQDIRESRSHILASVGTRVKVGCWLTIKESTYKSIYFSEPVFHALSDGLEDPCPFLYL